MNYKVIPVLFLALMVCSEVESEPIKISSSVQRQDPLPDASNSHAVEAGIQTENGTGEYFTSQLV